MQHAAAPQLDPFARERAQHQPPLALVRAVGDREERLLQRRARALKAPQRDTRRHRLPVELRGPRLRRLRRERGRRPRAPDCPRRTHNATSAPRSSPCSGTASELRALRREQLGDSALEHDLALVDHHQVVTDRLDLGEQVARDEHRDAAIGEAAQQRPNLADPGRVKTVGRLVEDHQLWARATAPRQHPVVCFIPSEYERTRSFGAIAEPDRLQHLGNPTRIDPPKARQHLEITATDSVG